MSLPAWDGGKDKGAFRTLSDVAGGTDGIRTVTQTQGDTTTTLRTRAGNPEMTIRKKGGKPITIEESKYELREFHHRDPHDTGMKNVIDPKLSQETRYLKSFTSIEFGKIKFDKPPTLDESEDAGWVEPEDSEFYEPVQIRSSDGIFAYTQYRPKRAKTSIGALRFKPMHDTPNDATIEELESTHAGFARREFHAPIAVETEVWSNLYDADTRITETALFMLMKYLVRPIKKVSATVKDTVLQVVFKKPVEDVEGARLYTKDHYDFNTNYFDHVWGFGNPYHGTLDLLTGVFTTENGTEIVIPQTGRWWGGYSPTLGYVDLPTDGGGALMIEFDKSYECVGEELPDYFKENGFSFKKYAIFSGAFGQYSPMHKLHRMNERWMYQCPDGTTYAIRCESDGFRSRRVKVQELPEAETYGVVNTNTSWYHTHWFGAARHNELWNLILAKPLAATGSLHLINCAKDGKTALVAHYPTSQDDGRLEPVIATAAGGSFKSHPVITLAFKPNVFIDTNHDGFGSEPSTMVKQGYTAGQMSPLGTDIMIKRRQESRDNAPVSVPGTVVVTSKHTVTIGAAVYTLEWQNTLDRVVLGYNNEGVPIPNDENFKVGCPQLGIDRDDNYLGATSFELSARVLNLGLFIVEFVELTENGSNITHQSILIGTLGQTLNITARSASDIYTQHPITGEILINKLPW